MRRAVIAWLVLAACGRIGFEEPGRAADDIDDAAPADAPRDALRDGPGDGATFCEYLPICTTGQVTCCTGATASCILERQGCAGTIARCSILTHQGCDPGWACCVTQQVPEPTCYNPQLPQPC